MEKETEMLDLLEKMIVDSAQRILGEVGQKVTTDEARNLVGKIGARIVFSPSLGKAKADEVILRPLTTK